MFHRSYNFDFLLKEDGSVVNGNVKILNEDGSEQPKYIFPESMPKLKYISDRKWMLCVSCDDVLYKICGSSLKELMRDVKFVVCGRHTAFILKFNGDLYRFAGEEIVLVAQDMSWISFYSNNYDNIEFGVFNDGSIAHFLNTFDDEGESLIDFKVEKTEIKCPKMDDIKFVRLNCICTNDNRLLVITCEKDVEIKEYQTPANLIDAFFIWSRRNKTIYMLDDNKAIYLGDGDSYIAIKNSLIEDIGISQFISCQTGSMFYFQTNRGYICTSNMKILNNITVATIFPVDFRPVYSYSSRYITTKSAASVCVA